MAINKYIDEGGKGGGKGVFNSKNFGLYTYCHQNPVIAIDPDGNDVILLNDPKAAALSGHNGVLIGNEKSGWTYYAKNGYASNTTMISNNKIPENSGVSFKSLSDFEKTQPKLDKHNYSNRVRLETTEAQDNKMIEKANETINTPYNVPRVINPITGETLQENCADFTGDVLDAANSVSDKKRNAINGDFYGPIMDGYTVPNRQFKSVKENNNLSTKPSFGD
jgi:hypothetical protein